MTALRLAATSILMVLALSLTPAPAPLHAQSTTTVTIQNFAFAPATITVAAGTTVVWTNKDSVDHAPVSDTNAWDAGDVPPGATSTGIVMNTPGTYPYHCAIHPDMMGTIVVTGSGGAPTATVPPVPTATGQAAATSTPTTIATTAPAPTATATSLPLSLKVSVGHKTVKAGAKQSITVKTAAGAAVSIVITFPDGARKRHSGTAPASGTLVWSFKQPAGHTRFGKHTARLVVTVTRGSGTPLQSKASYSIG